jgi:transcriptional regulator with XRE-family HTH domain
MPVDAALKVEALAKDFGSQRRLADALGVSPAQVSRWLRGQGIDERNAQRIDLLEAAMSSLVRLYAPEAVRDWLFGFNAHLRDRRPIDAIRQGDFDGVMSAISQERAGSFA